MINISFKKIIGGIIIYKNPGGLALLSAVIMTICTSLDFMIVSLALPAISLDLNVSMSMLSWIMMGYILFLTACVLFGGKLIDIYGIRRVLLTGFYIFIGGLLLASVSFSIELLISARCIQGIGGSFLLVGGPSLIKLFISEGEQIAAFGYLGMASAIGYTAGSALGGAIMVFNNWHLVFWIMLIPILAGLALTFFSIPEDTPISKGTPVNIPLIVLLFGSISSCIIGLNQGR